MEQNPELLNHTAELLKTLAHPVRLCIVKGLAENGECNVSHMQGCLKSPQSTISQHLQKLKSSGVISSRRQGLEVFYKIADQRIPKLLHILVGN